jgi:hypothetical protein
MLRKHSLTLALLLVVFVPVLLLSAGPAAAADEVFKATTAITLPAIRLPSGQLVPQLVRSFDISFVDPVVGFYFLADRTNKAVDVVETNTNSVVTQLGKGQFTGTAPCTPPAGPNDCAGPDGVLTVNHAEVWVGDGDSTIKVFNLSGVLTHTIPTCSPFPACAPTARRADELCFDPVDQLVVMANDAADPAPFITFIPTSGPQAYTVVKTIAMDGTNGTPNATNGIEQCQWSPRTGLVYLNIPEVNGPGDDSAPGAVVVISPATMEVVTIFDVDHDTCAGPQGMAIGPENQILLGCNASSSSVIINEHTGAIIRTLENEGGPDEVWFNPGDDHYFLARSNTAPQPQQLGVVDAVGRQVDQSIAIAQPGSPNAHSVAADPIKNQVYVPIPANHSDVCGLAGGNNALGCIAVFTTPVDDLPAPR